MIMAMSMFWAHSACRRRRRMNWSKFPASLFSPSPSSPLHSFTTHTHSTHSTRHIQRIMFVHPFVGGGPNMDRISLEWIKMWNVCRHYSLEIGSSHRSTFFPLILFFFCFHWRLKQTIAIHEDWMKRTETAIFWQSSRCTHEMQPSAMHSNGDFVRAAVCARMHRTRFTKRGSWRHRLRSVHRWFDQSCPGGRHFVQRVMSMPPPSLPRKWKQINR